MEGTYLVTGAGSGIGRAVACTLAEAGARVILAGRDVAKLEATRALLDRRAEHHLASTNVRDAASIRALLAGAGLEETGLHGVVVNAGTGGPNAYGEKDRWDLIVDVNLTGAYRTVQEALPYLKKTSGYRHIVLVSSVLARLGVPGYSAYCASKAGMLGLMRSLAAELAPRNILVNALCPGWVATDMAREGIEGFARQFDLSYEDALAQQMADVPLGKMSTPEEIAATVMFLVGGRQTSITGQALDINNGALMPA